MQEPDGSRVEHHVREFVRFVNEKSSCNLVDNTDQVVYDWQLEELIEDYMDSWGWI